MNAQSPILTNLRQEFDHWQDLLAGLSEEQLTARALPDNQSIQDVLAHLWAWLQISIARLEAAVADREPVYPDWVAGEDLFAEDVDRLNARIGQIYRRQPWAAVYQDWRAGFGRFLQLAEAIPEADLHDAEKYPWLRGYPLLEVLEGAYEHHHQDHLEPLLAYLREHPGHDGANRH